MIVRRSQQYNDYLKERNIIANYDIYCDYSNDFRNTFENIKKVCVNIKIEEQLEYRPNGQVSHNKLFLTYEGDHLVFKFGIRYRQRNQNV